MSLNIKNEKTHRLVRELARVKGESMTCRGRRGGTRAKGTGAAH
jgi:hypothetical protein